MLTSGVSKSPSQFWYKPLRYNWLIPCIYTTTIMSVVLHLVLPLLYYITNCAPLLIKRGFSVNIFFTSIYDWWLNFSGFLSGVVLYYRDKVEEINFKRVSYIRCLASSGCISRGINIFFALWIFVRLQHD